jgi:hypothetical protein
MVLPLGAAMAAGLFTDAIEAGLAIENPLIKGIARALAPEGEETHTEVNVPVQSSFIRSIGYRVGGVITVEMKRGGSGTYEYPGTEEEFLAFVMAPSKGEWFNAHLK